MIQHIVIGLLGGLALFLFGIELTGAGLQKLTGPRLETILKVLTRKKSTGIVLGILLTLSLQSSSAAGVVLINLVNTGLITLRNSISIILGAGLGTTIVVQIIAFKVTAYALVFVAGGFLLKSLGRTSVLKNTGSLVLGFGLIFYGMHLMGDGAAPLRQYPGIRHLFTALAAHPVLLILTATAFTALIQASAATISLAITLALNGILPASGLVPVVLGANLGTTITAVLASLGSTRQGKQVALAHVLVKLGGILLFLPFMGPFAQACIRFTARFGSTDLARQAANMHLLYNAGIMAVFLPLTGAVTRLILRLVPAHANAVKVRFMQPSLLTSPNLALAAVRAETVRLAEKVHGILDTMFGIIRDEKGAPEDLLPARELEVRELEAEIKRYLARISEQRLSAAEARMKYDLFRLARRFEQIADTVLRVQVPVITAKNEKGLSFSLEGGAEIRDIYLNTVMLFEQVRACVGRGPDVRERAQILHGISAAKTAVEKSTDHHLKRYQMGISDAVISGSVHLDLVYSLRTILDDLNGCIRLIEAVHNPKGARE